MVRISQIKRRPRLISEGEPRPTPLVRDRDEGMHGDVEQEYEVNLTDRTSFSYPFLIGSNGLPAFDAMAIPA